MTNIKQKLVKHQFHLTFNKKQHIAFIFCSYLDNISIKVKNYLDVLYCTHVTSVFKGKLILGSERMVFVFYLI
jgi:hypothetical protein